jgi:hypothetical protein
LNAWLNDSNELMAIAAAGANEKTHISTYRSELVACTARREVQP